MYPGNEKSPTFLSLYNTIQPHLQVNGKWVIIFFLIRTKPLTCDNHWFGSQETSSLICNIYIYLKQNLFHTHQIPHSKTAFLWSYGLPKQMRTCFLGTRESFFRRDLQASLWVKKTNKLVLFSLFALAFFFLDSSYACFKFCCRLFSLLSHPLIKEILKKKKTEKKNS